MDAWTMRNRSSKKRGSSTPGNNRGKAPKIIAYCPECPIHDMANPENSVHVGVNPKTREGICKNGHVFAIGGRSVANGA